MATIKDSKRDRPKHSAAALSKNFGGPKKGGAGRHGWGKLGDESRGAALNERDPNYESDYDENVSYEEIPIEAEPEAAVSKGFNESYQSIRKFKQAITQSVEEYLSTSNREEFIKSLTNLNLTMYHHEIPRLAILTSLDKSEEQRKKISFLLQYLHQHDYITVHQVQEAFRHLFNRLSDITLDIPNAETLLNQFLSSAVAAEYMTEKAAQSIARASEALKDVEQVKIAKTKIRDLLTEYFDNQDLGEAEARLTEMKAPHFHHILVKEAVSMSMDRSNRERELASYLLGNLSLEALDSAEIEKGFEYLLGRIDDLYNDVPKALEFLSCFIARAIVDELLPPAFVARRELPEQDMGAQVLKQASVLLSKKHPYHRLSRIWGPGDGREVPALKKAVKDLCSEYFSSGDSNEAKRCIKELNSPHFSHEVVMRLIVMAMDNGDKEVAAAIQLLKVLTAEGVVSKRQAELGFGRVFSALDELSLDQPNAKSIFQRISKEVGVSASA